MAEPSEWTCQVCGAAAVPRHTWTVTVSGGLAIPDDDPDVAAIDVHADALEQEIEVCDACTHRADLIGELLIYALTLEHAVTERCERCQAVLSDGTCPICNRAAVEGAE
jgi:hypothetical protein